MINSINCGGIFDPVGLAKENKQLEKDMSKSEFWLTQEKSSKIVRKFEKNKKLLAEMEDLDSQLSNLKTIMKDENFASTDNAAINLLRSLHQRLDILEQDTVLNGPYDKLSAHLFLHSGTGGVDAADWTKMLLNMYMKYAAKKGWQVSLIDQTIDSTGGIKSATLKIDGELAYGLLKAEKGVHRLIRLSPFNAQNLRQTSFALIEVIPDMGDIKEINLDDKELKIDVFRASGHGGQSVNTTDSAVRITHLPTKISVSVQNERSQTQNKETALKLLKHKVYLHNQEKRETQERTLKGADQSGDFGHQIRSYVMHPYHQIKDHRSGFITTQIKEVLEEGNLDELINSVILYKKDRSS